MKQLIFIFSMLCALCIQLFAQNDAQLNKAFSESFKLENENKYTEAANVLSYKYNEDSYEQNIRLGWLNYKASKFQSSNYYYNIAIKLMPYSIEAKLGATLPKAKLNLWYEIEQLYKNTLAIDAKNYTAHYYLGLLYYNQKKYKEAFLYFQELNNLYPDDYYSTLMHAWSNYRLGKNREAKVLFTRLLLLYPGDKSATEGLYLLN